MSPHIEPFGIESIVVDRSESAKWKWAAEGIYTVMIYLSRRLEAIEQRQIRLDFDLTVRDTQDELATIDFNAEKVVLQAHSLATARRFVDRFQKNHFDYTTEAITAYGLAGRILENLQEDLIEPETQQEDKD